MKKQLAILALFFCPAAFAQLATFSNGESGSSVRAKINAGILQTNTNTANIVTNTATIATNTANIVTNTANIATNTADIVTNTATIATNTANIAAVSNLAASAVQDLDASDDVTSIDDYEVLINGNTVTISPLDALTLSSGTYISFAATPVYAPADPVSGTGVGDRDFNDARYATAAQGALADTAVPLGEGAGFAIGENSSASTGAFQIGEGTNTVQGSVKFGDTPWTDSSGKILPAIMPSSAIMNMDTPEFAGIVLWDLIGSQSYRTLNWDTDEQTLVVVRESTSATNTVALIDEAGDMDIPGNVSASGSLGVGDFTWTQVGTNLVLTYTAP